MVREQQRERRARARAEEMPEQGKQRLARHREQVPEQKNQNKKETAEAGKACMGSKSLA